MLVKAGSTNVTTYFHLRLAADGTDATGITITELDLQYVRSGATPAAKVDASALAATDTAHTDNSAIEVDATDQPGLYRVDWPDAAFAAGVREVVLTVLHSTTFAEHLHVQITGFDAGVGVTLEDGAITAAKVGAAAIEATAFHADAIAAIQADLATAAEVADVQTAADAIQAVTDALVAAQAEPTGVPAANESPVDKIAYLFMALRNRVDVTATKKTFYDDGGTAEFEKDLSDNGTTYTETKVNAP